MLLGVVLHKNSIGAISGASWSIQIQENGQKHVNFLDFFENLRF
jgi:hypothetical protein